MTATEDRALRIPVGQHDGMITCVIMYVPPSMSLDEWAQFHRVLEAMMPALVDEQLDDAQAPVA